MASLKPIQPVKISHHAYEAIESAIVQCELGPGEVLSDRHLSEVLGVSRTPVRDALHQLEATGLVRQMGRSGWVVAGFEERDVHELFEVRRVLEPLGLQRLSNDWDEEAVRKLSLFFEAFPEHLSRELYESYLEHDRDFHKQIVAYSGNSRVIGFYAVIEKHVDRVRHFLSLGSKGRIDEVQQEHAGVCAAIAQRDLEAATSELVRHLYLGEENMIEFVRKRGLEAITGEETA